MEIVVCGNAYLEGKLEKCCIGIKQGKIAAVKKILKGEKFYDFGDKLILPAGIDIHVHFRDPGLTHKEDFESGTIAAAFGGIGTVMDMPNTIPPVTNENSFNDKLEIAKSKAYIDFGLYSAITENSDVAKLAEISTGFKLYMGETTGKLTFEKFKSLRNMLEKIPENQKKVLAIHAEKSDVLDSGIEKVPDDENKNLKAYSTRRPQEAEVEAVKQIIGFIRSTSNNKIIKQTKFHICHLSSSQSPPLISQVPGLSSEVTPHHLFLSVNNNKNLGPFGKVNPPIRGEGNRFEIWNAFNEGKIPILATDHAPHTEDEKNQSFNDAPAGIPGVECGIPLMLYSLKHGQILLDTFVNATSTNPAYLFELNKGRLRTGYDAELIVVDMRAEVTLKTNMLHSKCKWSPYINMPVIFPKMTISHGEIITKDDGIEGEPGHGIFIK